MLTGALTDAIVEDIAGVAGYVASDRGMYEAATSRTGGDRLSVWERMTRLHLCGVVCILGLPGGRSMAGHCDG